MVTTRRQQALSQSFPDRSEGREGPKGGGVKVEGAKKRKASADHKGAGVEPVEKQVKQAKEEDKEEEEEKEEEEKEEEEEEEDKDDQEVKKAKAANPPFSPLGPTKGRKKYHDILTFLHTSACWTLAHPSIPPGRGEIDVSPSSTASDDGATRPAPRPGSGHSKIPRNDDESSTKRLTYPNSDLTPFQTLLASVLISKPISHRLQFRAIETLLNGPFWLRTVADIESVGEEGVREALWTARTQHKEKSAQQVVELCRQVRGWEEEVVDDLKGMREKALEKVEEGKRGQREQVAKAIKETVKQIKGAGETAAEIFLRRVQVQWKEVFPFADDRALDAARRLGILKAEGGEGEVVDELARKVGEHVGFTLDEAREEGEEAECARWWFARTLDVLVGLDVEGQVEEARKRADEVDVADEEHGAKAKAEEKDKKEDEHKREKEADKDEPHEDKANGNEVRKQES
ncbi:hypothetical protein ACQY0O_001371 [Thecaphora frezii]